LGYDPTLSNERFIKIIQHRFPAVSGKDLFTAWQEASLIYPLTTGFHWGALDFQWYIEACKSRPGPANTLSGFHDLNRFITLPPHKGTDNVSIPDYVKSVEAGIRLSGTSPMDVSERIHRHADKALEVLETLKHGGDKHLRLTLEDIRAIAYLGKYYAHKIRGATEIALFRAKQQQLNKMTAVAELNLAAKYWRLYASTALGQYHNPLWTNRVGYCDWRHLFGHVLDDIELAGGTPRLQSMEATSGGTKLEAESAVATGLVVSSHNKGYTGNGYLGQEQPTRQATVQWTFDAPHAGTYLLELRYAMKGRGQCLCRFTVNETESFDLVCWTTGGSSVWAWDRQSVPLREGPNTIALALKGPLSIDHLNVLYTGPGYPGQRCSSHKEVP
jgi:hypothetical protein